MRITGLAIALMGVVIAAFCGITALSFNAPNENDAVIIVERRPAPDLTLPLVLAGAAFIGGTAMYLFGGRGYHEDRSSDLPPPAVQA